MNNALLKVVVLNFMVCLANLAAGAGGMALATDFYVAPAGDDSNTGTSISKPFKTIQKTASVATAANPSPPQNQISSYIAVREDCWFFFRFCLSPHGDFRWISIHLFLLLP